MTVWPRRSDACPQPFRNRRASAITVSGLPPRRGPDQCLPDARPPHAGADDLFGLRVRRPHEEQACLQAVFPTIFEDQLDGWWRGRTMWPTPRSWGTFTRWFDCQFHSMRLDLTDEPLVDRVIGHYEDPDDDKYLAAAVRGPRDVRRHGRSASPGGRRRTKASASSALVPVWTSSAPECPGELKTATNLPGARDGDEPSQET